MFNNGWKKTKNSHTALKGQEGKKIMTWAFSVLGDNCFVLPFKSDIYYWKYLDLVQYNVLQAFFIDEERNGKLEEWSEEH